MELNLSFFCGMLEDMDIGVLVTGKRGEYIYVNRTYCELTGKSRAFFTGKSISKLKQMGYLTSSIWEKVVQSLQPFSSVITISDSARHITYDALTTGVPHFDAQGELQYVVCTQEPLEHLTMRLQLGMLNRGVFIDPKFQGGGMVSTTNIIAESPQMKQLIALLSTVSKTDASVLVSGPSGSGKEVIAHYIHQSSKRSQEPFIALNCAAIPENLMESELFGYEKGAFTGASTAGKAGLIESAHGGTLFLDEINSMPMALQVKLLRVLEEKQATRVGSVKMREFDFRLICASNENLENLVAEKRFRSDLFYRINVISVSIPPLSQRKEDIIPLTQHYLKYFCQKYSCVKVLSEQAINRMLAYEWPGNVRELKNFIERIIIMSPNSELKIETIPSNLFGGEGASLDAANHEQALLNVQEPLDFFNRDDFSHRSYIEECERTLLLEAFKQFHTPAAVAKALKLDLSNVYRKIQKYQLHQLKGIKNPR